MKTRASLGVNELTSQYDLRVSISGIVHGYKKFPHILNVLMASLELMLTADIVDANQQRLLSWTTSTLAICHGCYIDVLCCAAVRLTK